MNCFIIQILKMNQNNAWSDLFFFRKKILSCGTTDVPILDFWWRLPWVSKPECVRCCMFHCPCTMEFWDWSVVWYLLTSWCITILILRICLAAAFPVLTQQTSNVSTDSGVSMTTTPHYVDPSNNKNNFSSHSNNISTLPSGGSSSTLRYQREKNVNLAPPCGLYATHDYIEVVDPVSGSDSDHEDPQTIAKLSLKYHKSNSGKSGGKHGRSRPEQPGRRGNHGSAAGGSGKKPRMPSPSREAGEYENAQEINRLQRLKNRISRTFGMSNDYTNAEEIDKLRKRGGRASAKISAYQVKNIIHMFEKPNKNTDNANDGVTPGVGTGAARGKTRTLPASMPSSPTKPNATASNGVVLRVHNNLAPSKSDPAGEGARTLPVGKGHALPGLTAGKSLNSRAPRPLSTHSMDSDGYMRPVIDPSSHASYIDLIPDPNVLNNQNNNSTGSGGSSGSRSQEEEDIYETTTPLPNNRC